MKQLVDGRYGCCSTTAKFLHNPGKNVGWGCSQQPRPYVRQTVNGLSNLYSKITVRVLSVPTVASTLPAKEER